MNWRILPFSFSPARYTNWRKALTPRLLAAILFPPALQPESHQQPAADTATADFHGAVGDYDNKTAYWDSAFHASSHHPFFHVTAVLEQH